jgi:hypothetical protein
VVRRIASDVRVRMWKGYERSGLVFNVDAAGSAG